MSNHFKGVDVRSLLAAVANSVLNSIPDQIDSAVEVSEYAAQIGKDLGLESLAVDVEEVFQLETIAYGKEFKKGFPGVVLTATVGRIVDPDYSPSTHFYGISPRSLFENHIRPVLHDAYGAPMGKSDPLNVAKNENKIKEAWARGRRPESAAMATVRLTEYVEKADSSSLKDVLRLLTGIYLLLSKLYHREYEMFAVGPGPGLAHLWLCELIEQAPAGGATAQAVVGALLEAQHQLFGAAIFLSGVGESVFATNSTSKKPGDFLETFEDQTHVYEVTTKKVDIQRVVESSEAVLHYLAEHELQGQIEVTFLCYLDDVSLNLDTNGGYRTNGVPYHFLDIEDWLFHMLERLGPHGREVALKHVNAYVGSSSTDLRVKNIWDVLISGQAG